MKIIFQTGGLLRKVFPALLICCSAFLFTECKRTLDEAEFNGPGYALAPEGFAITEQLTGSRTTLNGNATPPATNFFVKFWARFSHNVSWTLTLTGQQSGAIKTFTGTSNFIDSSIVKWYGESTSLKFFKKGESVKAVVTFLGSSLTSDTWTISTIINTKSYNSRTWNGVKYTLIDDFEAAATATSLTGRFQDVLDGTSVNGISSDYFLSGAYSYHMKGTDVNPNSYINGVNTDPLETALVGFVTVTDPNSLYLNAYIYGTGKNNTAITFKVYELDYPIVPGSTYDQKTNDAYVNDVIVNWTGWKLVSLKYADFKRASDPNSGGNGNNIKEPHKINGLVMQLGSLPTVGKDADAYIEFLTFTENGIFVP